MTMLVTSAKASEVPGGFNIKSILFCCFKHNADCEVVKEEVTQIEEVQDSDAPVEQHNDLETTFTEPTQEITPIDADPIDDGPPTQTELQQECEAYEEDEIDAKSDYDVNMATVKEHEIIDKTKTSELRLRLGYDNEKSSLNITIVDSYDLARPSSSTNSIRERVIIDVAPVLAYSVHVLVLPLRKLRFKTKMRQGPDPFFDEVIKIPKVRLEDIKHWSLRFRLYGSMRNAMKGIIGEGFLLLDSLNLEFRAEYKVALLNHQPNMPEKVVSSLISTGKCNQGSILSLDSIDRMTSQIEGDVAAEVLIGLSYSANTARLTIEIMKGNKFPRQKDNKQPDTQIGIVVISSKGEEIASSKTSVKKASCEPTFEEKFIFQILVYQLEETTLTITGYHKRSLGKTSVFGSFTMGNKNSTEEESSHWRDLMSSGCSDQILRWHTFMSPNQS